MIDIKHNDIIIWKGVEWSKLLKFDKYNISRLAIQLVTLSRYTHTGIYLKMFEKEYLLQSTLIGGMKIIEITGQMWFRNNIDDNIYDLYRFDKKIHELSPFQSRIQGLLVQMYSSNIKSAKLGSYSINGIINIGCLNLFNKYYIKSTKIDKMFCSELTNYYFTNSKYSFLESPFDISDNDIFRKVR